MSTDTNKTKTGTAKFETKVDTSGDKAKVSATAKGPNGSATTDFTAPRFDVAETMRDFTETGLSQARETYRTMKVAAEDATDALGETMEATRGNVVALQHKALEAAKSNTDATFDFYKSLLETRTLADALELQTSFARKRFEAMMEYSKDMQAETVKFTENATRPMQDAFEKSRYVA